MAAAVCWGIQARIMRIPAAPIGTGQSQSDALISC